MWPKQMSRRVSLSLSLVLSVLVLPCAQAHGLHAQDWPQAVRAVMALPVFQGVPLELKVRKAKAGEPLMRTRTTERLTCELTIRPEPREHTEALRATVNPVHQRALVQAYAFHEFTACWRWHQDPAKYEGMVSLAKTADPKTPLGREAWEAYAREEAFADVATLAWLEKAHPYSYPALLAVWRSLRSLPSDNPSNTLSLRAFERIQAYGMIYGDTPFDAADTTLAALSQVRYTVHTQAAKGKPVPNQAVIDQRPGR